MMKLSNVLFASVLRVPPFVFRLPCTYKMDDKQRIEVERKYEASLDAESLAQQVVSRGGRLIGEVRFFDSYFDTTDCTLIRSDTWLRRRNGDWELKVPVDDDAQRSGGERTVFCEIVGSDQVWQALVRLRPTRFGAIEKSCPQVVDGAALLEQAVKLAELEPFAEFETVRMKLSLGQCAIDLDVAFGLSLIEIEVMCERQDQVHAAIFCQR